MMTASIDYIYFLVIILIAFIGSVMGQNKKKKSSTASDQPVEDAPKDTPLPDPFRGLMSRPTVTPTASRRVVQNASTLTKKKGEHPFLSTKEEGVPVTFAEGQLAQPPVKAEEETGESDYAIRDMDDLKKAIIWSEIIHRKY